MSESDDKAAPVLAYEHVGEDHEMAWALRYAGWWIIALSLLTVLRREALLQLAVLSLPLCAILVLAVLHKPMKWVLTAGVAGLAATVAAMALVLPKSFGMLSVVALVLTLPVLVGALIGVAVQRSLRWGMIAAIVYALLTPIGLTSGIWYARGNTAPIVVLAAVKALIDAAVLWALMRRADGSGVLLPIRPRRPALTVDDRGSVFALRLVGWHLAGQGVAFLGFMVMTQLMSQGTMSAGPTWNRVIMFGNSVMLVMAGALMVLRHASGLQIAIGASVASLIAHVIRLMLQDVPLVANLGSLAHPAISTLVMSALMLVLYRRTQRTDSMPAAVARE